LNKIHFISVHPLPSTQNTSNSGLGHDIHVSFSWGIANWWSIPSLAPYALLRKTNPAAGPLNPYLTGNILRVTQLYVACEDICNEKMSFNPFPGKAEIECASSFEKL